MAFEKLKNLFSGAGGTAAGEFYAKGLHRSVSWLGLPVYKSPADLWVLQEIITDTRPDVVIETKTAEGGLCAYLATVMDILDCGRVISIDAAEDAKRVKHARITYISGAADSEGSLAAVKSLVGPSETVMLIANSGADAAAVAKELALYVPLVSKDCYVVIEHTHTDGGPRQAARQFLKQNPDFQADASRERYMLSFSPGGFFRRKQ